MTIDRIDYLFQGRTLRPETEARDCAVLKACCLEAKARAEHLNGLVGFIPLTGFSFTIDDVMRHLPVNYGTPTQPDYGPRYPVYEVIDALNMLKTLGYLTDFEGGFTGLSLTSDLFRAVAEEWVYARGAAPFRLGSEKIFAQSAAAARRIDECRLARLSKKSSRARSIISTSQFGDH